MQFYRIEVQVFTNPSSRPDKIPNTWIFACDRFLWLFLKKLISTFSDVFEDHQPYILISLHVFYYLHKQRILSPLCSLRSILWHLLCVRNEVDLVPLACEDGVLLHVNTIQLNQPIIQRYFFQDLCLLSVLTCNFKGHLRVIIWERQNQLEIEKIDFLEILPIFKFCHKMNKNAHFSQFFTSVSMATTVFYF